MMLRTGMEEGGLGGERMRLSETGQKQVSASSLLKLGRACQCMSIVFLGPNQKFKSIFVSGLMRIALFLPHW